jgi:hypothetical protein
MPLFVAITSKMEIAFEGESTGSDGGGGGPRREFNTNKDATRPSYDISYDDCPCRHQPAGGFAFAIRSRAKIPQAHDLANIVEARQRVVPRNGAGLKFRQLERNLLGKIAKFVPCQVHQFGNRPVKHRFLHRVDRANRGLLTEAPATEEADASLATATKWRSANGTCIHEPTAGAIRPT